MKNAYHRQIMRSILVTLVLFSLAVSGLGTPAAASTPEVTRTTQGPMVIVRAGHSNSPMRVPPPRGFSTLGAQNATITVKFNGTWDPDARSAFQHAVDIWASQINSSVEIVVDAHWKSMDPGVLGSARASNWFANFSSAALDNTWYPVALANAAAGQDINENDGWDDDDDGLDADVELIANFNRDFSSWYFGTDGNTPIDKWDFSSVVLHELCHGLGFGGSMTVSGGRGSWGLGSSFPFIYDRFAENGAGDKLISAFPNNSGALAAQLQSENVYFNGPNANAANGATRPKLYAPSSWIQGSSYSHLDENFNGTPNALMTFALNNGESVHDPGPVVRGMFRDMGWTLTSPEPTAPDLSLSMRLLGDPDPDPGDAVTFALTITNAGAGLATGVVVANNLSSDILAPSWTASASLSGLTHRTGTTYVWDLPALAAQASGTITVTGTINPLLLTNWAIVNAASVNAAQQETDTSNNGGAVIVGGRRTYLPLALGNRE